MPIGREGRNDFTDILVKQHIVTADQLAEARTVAEKVGMKLQEALVKHDYASEDQVLSALAEFHGMEFVKLTEVTVPPSIVERVPESVARENIVLPLTFDNNVLRVAVSDPADFETQQKLQFILNTELQPVLCAKEQIVEAINRHYGQTETESVDSMLAEFTDTQIDFTETEAMAGAGGAAGMAGDESDAPVVKLVNLMFQEAVNLRASDIHIEPFSDRVRVRYRIDGVLIERDSPPRRLHAPIMSRMKIMGKMDIAERRRPQDGRIKVNIGGKHYDLRVSVLPSSHGQAAVLRILDRGNIQMNIKDLGFAEDDYQRFLQIIKRPNGIFLVTGPTGSGKTTTLYGALNELNRPDRKIITAEDPVEYYLPGVNQCEVKHQIGLDFARILRAMLRQAPNIILVGEIRDKETAEIAIQASLTGHLVFSTLHTNDAPGAITRLVDIGMPPFLVASSLVAIMAQRLVRLVCPKCKEADQPPKGEIQAAGLNPEKVKGASFMRGRGCNYCHHSGYRGRLAIFELLKMTGAIRDMTFRREPTQSIRRQARLLGMRTLLEDGVNKALRGVTTLEEVLSTCHHEGEEM
jgi:type IV pilus assembly protein PilB